MELIRGRCSRCGGNLHIEHDIEGDIPERGPQVGMKIAFEERDEI